MRIIVSSWFLVFPFLVMPTGVALAAPQILAVLATEDGISLTCDDGLCAADLSTFCLQRARPAPNVGTEYVPAAPDQFTLVVIDASGRERRLPASRHVTFSERRGFTAASAYLPEKRLFSLGAVRARLEIGARASLVPKPVEGDRFPQSREEIRHATGAARALGARIVDASPRGAAARALGAIVNRLPREGREDASRYEELWDRAVRDGAAGRPGRAGIGRARREFDQCLRSINNGAAYRLRGCLTVRHDKIMRDLSVEYWNAGAGS